MLDKIIQNKLTEIEILKDNQKYSINDLSRMNFQKREFKGSLMQKIKIGKNNVIGANSTVINNIKNNSLVVGSPAKKKK